MGKEKAIVFGVEFCTRHAVFSIERAFEILCYTDNEEKMWGSRMAGKYDILSPEEAFKLDFDKIVVVANDYGSNTGASYRFFRLYSELCKLGINPNNPEKANSAKASVIVYGAGAAALEILSDIERNYQIICFTDSDENKHGGKIYDCYDIVPVREALEKKYEKIIISSSSFYDQIYKSLVSLGIDESMILPPYTCDSDCFFPDSGIIIPHYVLEKPRVLAYGTGRSVEWLLPDIEKYFDIISFVDSNKHKWGAKIAGKKILSPGKAFASDYDYVLITSVDYYDQIEYQLCALGIPKHKILPPYQIQNLSINIKDMIFCLRNEFGLGLLSIAGRYLAIENYHGMNDFGFELYEKLTTIVERDSVNGSRVQQFKRLIESYKQMGYNGISEIGALRNYTVHNGGHRLALHIFHNIKEINVSIYPKMVSYNPINSFSRIISNVFSDFEIKALMDKSNKLRERLNTGIIAILWPTVQDFFDDIIKDLSYLCEVEDKGIIHFDSDAEFGAMVRKIYRSDVNMLHTPAIAMGIEKKIEVFGSFEKNIRVLKLKLPDYGFRQSGFGYPASDRLAYIKDAIREKYMKTHLFFERGAVIHGADNFTQSAVIESLIDLKTSGKLDLYDFFESIKDLPYVVLTNTKDKKRNPEFPKRFPGTDVDLLCAPEYIEEIINKAEAFLKRVSEEDQILKTTIFKASEYVTSVCLCVKNHVIFNIDIAGKIGGLSESFSEDFIKARVQDRNYYIPDKEYDYIRKIVVLNTSKHKFWHLDYLTANKQEFNQGLFEKYLPNNLFAVAEYRGILARIGLIENGGVNDV